MRENVPRTTFNVSAPALIEITRQTYSELLTDDSNLSKVLLPEYIDYYGTCMLWFRIINLKQKNSQRLTPAETDLLTLIQTAPFCIPEPILLQLKQLGNITTKTGQNLFPRFPALPVAVLAQHGGYYGQFRGPAPLPQLEVVAPIIPGLAPPPPLPLL